MSVTPDAPTKTFEVEIRVRVHDPTAGNWLTIQNAPSYAQSPQSAVNLMDAYPGSGGAFVYEGSFEMDLLGGAYEADPTAGSYALFVPSSGFLIPAMMVTGPSIGGCTAPAANRTCVSATTPDPWVRFRFLVSFYSGSPLLDPVQKFLMGYERLRYGVWPMVNIAGTVTRESGATIGFEGLKCTMSSDWVSAGYGGYGGVDCDP
jgi:hypothetical protein